MSSPSWMKKIEREARKIAGKPRRHPIASMAANRLRQLHLREIVYNPTRGFRNRRGEAA